MNVEFRINCKFFNVHLDVIVCSDKISKIVFFYMYLVTFYNSIKVEKQQIST